MKARPPLARTARPRGSIDRARLLAARLYPWGSVPRRGIMLGLWDGGHVVGQFLEQERTS